MSPAAVGMDRWIPARQGVPGSGQEARTAGAERVLINVTPILMSRKWDSRQLALTLLKEHSILVNPGSLFHNPQCLQLCFAQSIPQLQAAGAALFKALGEL